MSESVKPRRTRAWKSPEALGEPEAIRGMGGIVAPLLAGFSLATVGLLVVSARNSPPWTEYAVPSFVICASAFLFAMQFSFYALRYSTSPEERLGWRPEARLDEEVLTAERALQAKDRALFERYANRAAFFYNLGVLAFLAGFGFLVIPTTWDLGRVICLAIIGFAILVECVWTVSRWLPLGRIGSALTPQRDAVQAGIDPLDDVSRRAMMADANERGDIGE